MPEDTQHDADFEAQLDALLCQLQADPNSSPASLIARFPTRQREILKTVEAATLEPEDSKDSLPPLPENCDLENPNQRANVAGFRGVKSHKTDVTEGTTPQIPDYELQERVGRGGMGDVYRAQQLRPIKREVAVKVIRSDFAGEDVIGRFENERHSLARMNHPNIATVLDAGTTLDGRPYFVMEYVEGEDLASYCANNSLGLRARLELFQQVLSGIQHAHQKGIIHRDIKPSNTLVAMVDKRPTPKVIDFGLAKVFAEDSLTVAGQTEFGQILGTLTYMSPEQARMQVDGVDTRTDVFSLGVVLFEILTGRTPLSKEVSSALPIDERLRAVREQIPRRPSAILVSMQHQEGRDSTASSGFQRQLRGDVDAICTKAMATEPADRYQTVAAFAEDIQRFIEERPVLATKPSELQQFTKLLYRYRVAVSVAALFLLTLFSSAVFSLWFGYQASVAAEEAEIARLEEAAARGEAEQSLYFSQMLLAQQSIEEKEPAKAKELLERFDPTLDGGIKRDIRGPEWYYLMDQVDAFVGQVSLPEVPYTLAVANDGFSFFSGDMAGGLCRWSLDSLEQIRSYETPGAAIGDIAVSPQDKFIAATFRSNPIRIFSVATGEKTHELYDSQTTRCVGFSADSKSLIGGSINGTLRVYDLASGKLKKKIEAHQKNIYCLEFSTDGKLLATASSDHTVRVWRWPELTLVSTLEGHSSSVRTVSISQGNQFVAAGANDGDVLVWSAAGELIHELVGHSEEVYGSDFSEDGQVLVTASRDESVRLWRMDSGVCRKVIPSHRFTNYASQFVPRSSLMVSCAHDKKIRVWDVSKYSKPSRFRNENDLLADFDLSEDARFLVKVGDDNAIELFDLNDFELVSRISGSEFDDITGVKLLLQNGLSKQAQIVVAYMDGVLVRYAARSGQELQRVEYQDRIYGWDFSPDKSMVAVGFKSGIAQVLSVSDFQLLYEIEAHENAVFGLRFSPSGKQIATCGDDSYVLISDLESGKEPRKIAINKSRLYALDYSPDGQKLALGGREQVVWICDVSSGKRLKTLQSHSASVHRILFTSDGDSLISGASDQKIIFWDLQRNQPRGILTSGELQIQQMQLVDEDRVFAAADGRQVRIWYKNDGLTEEAR